MGGPKFTTLLNRYCSSGLEFICVTTGALLSVVVCGQSLTNEWDNNKLVIAVTTCQIEYKIVQKQ